MKDRELYVDLIGNPFAPKKYRELAKYYEKIGRHDAAEAFQYALKIKFETSDEFDSPPTDQEQRDNSE